MFSRHQIYSIYGQKTYIGLINSTKCEGVYATNCVVCVGAVTYLQARLCPHTLAHYISYEVFKLYDFPQNQEYNKRQIHHI